MKHKYHFAATYYTNVVGAVELPEGKTWDDVEDWYVKWDTLHYLLKGDDKLKGWKEVPLNSDVSGEVTDWKRPSTVEIYPSDDSGEIDWNEEIDSQ